MLSFRRSFPVNPEALAPGHPYSLDNSRHSCQIPFIEFRAPGPPSSNFGNPGDVYVDLTPGSYALYWRERVGRNPGQWKRWTALLLDQVPLYKYLVSHPWADDPQISDLYLWVDPTGVTWTSRAEICASRVLMIQKSIATITPGERNPDVEALVTEILVKMIDAEDRRTLPPILDERERDGYSRRSPPYSAPPTGRTRSHSTASQYSSPDAHAHLPPSPRPPAKRRNTNASPPPHSSPNPPHAHTHAHRSPRSPQPYPPPQYTRPLTRRPSSGSPRLSYPDTPPRPPPQPGPASTSPRVSYSDLRAPIDDPYRRHEHAPPPLPPPAEYPPGPPHAHPPPPPPHTHHHRRDHDRQDSPSPPLPPPPPPPQNHAPHPSAGAGTSEQEMRESFAWTEMQRAQYAEAHFKRELRQKNRELAKFKKKEKDIISLSFTYQKKEQELLAALASAEKRGNEEIEKQREAVRVAQRQVEEAEQQTRDAVRELRRVEEALTDAREEISRLKTYAEQMEVENEGLKDEMTRYSQSQSRPDGDRPPAPAPLPRPSSGSGGSDSGRDQTT